MSCNNIKPTRPKGTVLQLSVPAFTHIISSVRVNETLIQLLALLTAEKERQEQEEAGESLHKGWRRLGRNHCFVCYERYRYVCQFSSELQKK